MSDQIQDTANTVKAADTGIYTPEIAAERPLDIEIGSAEYASKLQNAQEDGMIMVKLEEAVVRDRISHDLYAKPSSGLRELFANEARACRTAQREHNATPKIEVTVNNLSRQLTIHGHDSMGIDQELFVNVVRYLGRSNNFSGKETGQFGFGLASYTCLSDIMILETYSRQTGEKYAVMGKGGVGFQILPEPDMESYGTRITVTLKDTISLYDLLSDLANFAMFCGIDTYLIVEGNEITARECTYDVGVHRLERMTFAEKLDRESRDNTSYKTIQAIPVEIHEDDYELYGRFVFKQWVGEKDPTDPDTIRLDYDYYRHKTLLLGLPINVNINVPFSSCIINILNEREYRPTPDRERLAEESAKRLEKQIRQKILEFFKKGEIKQPDEYAKHKYNLLYRHRSSHGINTYLTERATDVLDFLETRIVTGTDKRTNIGAVLKPDTKLVKLKSLRSNKVNAIYHAFPNATVFRLIPWNSPASLEIIGKVQYDVLDGDEYLGQHGIKYQNIDGARMVTARRVDWKDWWPYPQPKSGMKITRIMSDKLEDCMIRASKNQTEMLHETMRVIKSEYMTVMDADYLKGGIKYDDLIRNAGMMEVHTNDGLMTMDEAVSCGKNVCVIEYDDAAMLEQVKSDNCLIIMRDVEDELFQIVSFLKAHGTPYVFDTNRYEGGSLWNALGMDKFVDESDIHRRYGEDKDRLATLLKVAITAKSIMDEQVLRIFLQLAGDDKDSKKIDGIYGEMKILDQKIADLQAKAFPFP